ncbi:DUF3892 domain-containing protein [Desulfovibrio desulfuricans]|uniref:DUF3892 domain-containing protein n=1 Tax=Desulfovibrio desulfuricans TaxID=876 RepID=UPI001C033BFF|nr:DUF3892 domain-containing protein [Desulfovibrio desulfuricans]MBT9748514.1 DUF3892 domain-containing protein [Desulfovibrio desulfuricans]
MADFCITAVSYTRDKRHIRFVQVHEELKGEIGLPRIVQREFIADLIRLKKATFITRIEDGENYVTGADVHIVDDEYLTTNKNSTKRDNLENLPEF